MWGVLSAREQHISWNLMWLRNIVGILCVIVDVVQGHACPITNGIFVAACENQGLEFIPWDLPHSIHMFHLENNNLAKLTGTPFFKFIYMEELWLRNNSLTLVEDSVFQGCTALLWIDLSENKLTEFPSKAFKNTPKLRHLYLNDNDITYIADGAFSQLGELQNLYLTKNKIHAIAPHGFTGLTSLRWLELQDNRLRKLDPLTVQSFQNNFLAIKLHQNPWHCDCSMRWLKQWLTAMARNYTLHWEFDLARPVCHSPWMVEGKAFSEIPDKFFVCPVHILSKSRTIALKARDTVKLTCEVNADPQAIVYWYHNGNPLETQETDKYIVTNDGTVHLRSSLFIYNFQASDIGSYNCRAVNPAGANNVTFMVNIEGYDPENVQHAQTVIVKTKLNVVTITAIVVGALVLILVIIVIICIVIYRRRAPDPHYGVQMKLDADAPNHNGYVEGGDKPDDIDEDMMKQCNKLDTVDPLYDSIKARNVQYRNSLNTSTYISFKSEPSDPEDLAMLYASMPKRRYNGSIAGSHNESLSPLLAPYPVPPPRLPYHVEPLHVNETSDFSTIPLHPQHSRPPSRAPSYCSTPPQHRHHPQKSCSMGSLGMTPPKKPPRLHTYASPNSLGTNPRNRNSMAGTISLLRAGDSVSTAV